MVALVLPARRPGTLLVDGVAAVLRDVMGQVMGQVMGRVLTPKPSTRKRAGR
jgi:hypothetical protein